jgi:ubiquitin carboxyl-terminal hydrolase 9/24
MQADKLASWVKENNVLTIVFRDNLHQPQYVEKLDKLVRFCIKEKVLSLQDLNRIWAAQDGKHEIIVKNIHDLLVKLAWDFSPEQLDHLFGCFQRSWVGASKKQCEELLEFIRHLAEDDKEGVMAVKVLDLMWNLAHREDCPPDTMDHALSAHIKILDYSCSQERESQKLHWLQRCVEDLSNEMWVIPALKHMKEICLLYLESPVNYVHSHHRQSQFYYRNEIISHLDTNYHLLSHICQNMELYMRKARAACEKGEKVEPEALFVDGRFSHTQQLMARLDFVRFALKDGQLWLGHQQALMMWESLVEKPAFASDRDTCFRWFAKLVSDEPDIEPDTVKKLFTENLHRMPPQHLTENGFRCFDRFFRMVNINERRLSAWRRGFITENVDLVGLEYLWKAVLLAPDSIVYKPIELLKDVYTNLSNKLQQDQFHLDFIQTCMQRLQVAYDNLQQFHPREIENDANIKQSFNTEISKLVRCLSLLKEYVIECDEEYQEERGIPAHGKAMWGRAFLLVVRYSSHHQQPAEDFELSSHSNETIAAVRRHILQRLKLSYQSRLELSVGNEVLRVVDDRRLVSAVPLRDRAVLNAKLLFSNVSETSMNSSDNSTDSSEGSPMNHMEGPNIEAEKLLPSVLIASEQKNVDFLLSLCDFAILRDFPLLRDSVRNLLKLLPTGTRLLAELLDHCRESAQKEGVSAYNSLQSYFISPTPSPSRTLYLLEIAHAMLMPSVDFRDSESLDFQVHFVMCGGLKLLLSFLTDKKALAGAGNVLKRSAMMTIMKMLRLLLTASAYGCIVQVVQEMKNNQVSDERHKAATILQTALQNIIPVNEQKLRHTSSMLARQYWEKLISPLPDISVVRSIQLLAWSAACGDVSLSSDPTSIHNAFTKVSTELHVMYMYSTCTHCIFMYMYVYHRSDGVHVN